MRILVTGGCGYLGSVLLPQLFPICHRIDVLDSRIPLHDLRLEKIRYFRALEETALREYEFVIHLAGQVGFPACERDPGLAQERNVESLRQILKVRGPRAGVLLASTTSVYGAQVTRYPVDETFSLNPSSVYGQTKKAAEDLLRAEKDWVILRFASGFGPSPRMRHDNLIHDFTRRAVQEKSLNLYEATFVRQFVHVRDMAESLVFAVRSWDRVKNHVFNVGNPALQMPKSQLVKEMQKTIPFTVKAAEGTKDQDRRSYPVSFNKLSRFGFTPRTGLTETLKELASYYVGETSSLEKKDVETSLERNSVTA